MHHAGKPDERAVSALVDQAPNAEMVHVSNTPASYCETIVQIWREGEPFILIEQAVIVGDGVIASLEACEWPWCSVAKADRQHIHDWRAAGLCCNKFDPRQMPKALTAIELLQVRHQHWMRLYQYLLPLIASTHGLRRPDHHAVHHVHHDVVIEHERKPEHVHVERVQTVLAWQRQHAPNYHAEL
jgi:hypothetical protein